MSVDNVLNFSNAMSFINGVITHMKEVDIEGDNIQSFQENLDKTAVEFSENSNKQIAEYIDQFMERLKELSSEHQQSIMKFFLGDTLLYMLSGGLVDEFKKESGPGETEAVLRMKCSNLLSEVAKQDLEIRIKTEQNEAMKTLLDDQCEHIQMLQGKTKQLKGQIKESTRQYKALQLKFEDRNQDVCDLTKKVEQQEQQISNLITMCKYVAATR